MTALLIAALGLARGHLAIAAMRHDVITTMERLEAFKALPVQSLEQVPIVRMRKDAHRTLAVCRIYDKPRSDWQVASHVREIGLHPVVIDQPMEWGRYGRFLLFHEYIHALGFVRHDRVFRSLERIWDEIDPGTRTAEGSRLVHYLAARRCQWVWRCASCDRVHYRRRRQNSRYTCTNTVAHGPGIPLLDELNPLWEGLPHRAITS